MEFYLGWLEQTGLSIWVREAPTLLAFPLVLIFHTIGLGFLAGPALTLDLLLLGFARDIPLTAMRKFIPVGCAGLALLLVLKAFSSRGDARLAWFSAGMQAVAWGLLGELVTVPGRWYLSGEPPTLGAVLGNGLSLVTLLAPVLVASAFVLHFAAQQRKKHEAWTMLAIDD